MRTPSSAPAVRFGGRTASTTRFVGPAVVAAVALVVGSSSRHATSWHFFRDAAHLLLAGGSIDGGGLDVYLAHPEFQFGPLAVVAAAPFALLPSSLGTYAVLGFGTLLGAAATLGIEITVRRVRADAGGGMWERGRLVGELTLAIVWADVAVRTAHLDDAIALACAALACAAVARDRPGLATVALALAAAAKPWAIVFAPLALVPPGRFRVARIGVVAAGVAGTWLPFIADEPASIAAAGSFRITNAPSSALRALGFTDPATPSWVRPTQLVVGLLLVLALARTRRWPAIIMVGLAVRVMLDPGVHHYYAAGLVLGTLLWESVVRPGRLPLIAIGTAVIMEVTPTEIHPSALAGFLRLALTAGLIAAAFAWGDRRPFSELGAGSGSTPAVATARPAQRGRTPAATVSPRPAEAASSWRSVVYRTTPPTASGAIWSPCWMLSVSAAPDLSAAVSGALASAGSLTAVPAVEGADAAGGGVLAPCDGRRRCPYPRRRAPPQCPAPRRSFED